jgi:uncharacterized Zn-finger protein
MSFFKPEDFRRLMMNEDGARDVSERANELIQERGVRVYCSNKHGDAPSKVDFGNTHQALLVAIEELPKKTCEHEPSPVAMTTNQETVCQYCGVNLKAKWDVAE